MTQEEKDWVLHDICARLPYGVKIKYKYYPDNIFARFATGLRFADNKIALSSKFNKEGEWYSIEEAGEILIKPYLRPMSSMTEEEQKEFVQFHCTNIHPIIIADDLTVENQSKMFDWLLKKHFDFRGLIPAGAAIEVTEDNNPYKE